MCASINQTLLVNIQRRERQKEIYCSPPEDGEMEEREKRTEEKLIRGKRDGTNKWHHSEWEDGGM